MTRGPPSNVLSAVSADRGLSDKVKLLIGVYASEKYGRQTRIGMTVENFVEDRKRRLQQDVMWLLERHAGNWRGVSFNDELLWQVVATLTEFKGGDIHNNSPWKYSRPDFLKATSEFVFVWATAGTNVTCDDFFLQRLNNGTTIWWATCSNGKLLRTSTVGSFWRTSTFWRAHHQLLCRPPLPGLPRLYRRTSAGWLIMRSPW